MVIESDGKEHDFIGLSGFNKASGEVSIIKFINQ
jgi:hypothetical protein